MRLRARFTAASSTLVLVVLGATGTLQYAAERRQLVRAQAAAQEAAVRALAKACEEAIVDQNDIAALNYFKAFRETPAWNSAALAGPGGGLRLHSDALQGKTDWQGRTLADQAAQDATLSKGLVRDEADEGGVRVVRWTAPLAFGGEPAGLLRLTFNSAEMDRVVRESLASSARRFLVVALCCLALGVLGAAWLAQRLVDPIDRLAEAARRYSEGKLDHRVSIAERSELGLLASDLNRMAERLGEMDELKRRFFHQLTHDLRVPLSSIQGYLELLLSGKAGAISSGQRAHLVQAEEGAQVLADFVDNILDLARMHDPRATERGTCEVRGAVEKAVALVQGHAQQLGVRVEAEFLEPGAVARMPEHLVRRVLLNLLGNALKFTPQGGRVTVAARRTGEGLVLEVRDTGCGIPPDKVGKIFEEFYRVPETMEKLREPAGVGIGLSICKAMVEAHGGSISVESELGHGARFTVGLRPASPEAARA